MNSHTDIRRDWHFKNDPVTPPIFRHITDACCNRLLRRANLQRDLNTERTGRHDQVGIGQRVPIEDLAVDHGGVSIGCPVELHPERRSKLKPSELILGDGPRGADFYNQPDGELLHLSNWIECIRSRKRPARTKAMVFVSLVAIVFTLRIRSLGTVVRFTSQ